MLLDIISAVIHQCRTFSANPFVNYRCFPLYILITDIRLQKCIQLMQISVRLREDLMDCLSSVGVYRSGVACETVDHCASQPCKNGASCVPGADGFSCRCLAAFKGGSCTIDVDECRESTSGAICENGGLCRNVFGGYE